MNNANVQTIKAILSDARDLVANGWNRFHYAEDENGSPTSPSGPDASTFCAIGAVQRACGARGTLSAYTYNAAYQALGNAIPTGLVSLGTYNDHKETTHTDIVDLFDRAIKGVN